MPLRALLFCLPVLPAQIPEEILKKGSALVQSSRLLEAEAALHKIRAEDPEYPQAQAMLGLIFLQRADLQEAEAAFGRALEAQQANAQARLGLGLSYIREGKLEEADEVMRVLSENPPIHPPRVVDIFRRKP